MPLLLCPLNTLYLKNSANCEWMVRTISIEWFSLHLNGIAGFVAEEWTGLELGPGLVTHVVILLRRIEITIESVSFFLVYENCSMKLVMEALGRSFNRPAVCVPLNRCPK